MVALGGAGRTAEGTGRRAALPPSGLCGRARGTGIGGHGRRARRRRPGASWSAHRAPGGDLPGGLGILVMMVRVGTQEYDWTMGGIV